MKLPPNTNKNSASGDIDMMSQLQAMLSEKDRVIGEKNNLLASESMTSSIRNLMSLIHWQNVLSYSKNIYAYPITSALVKALSKPHLSKVSYSTKQKPPASLSKLSLSYLVLQSLKPRLVANPLLKTWRAPKCLRIYQMLKKKALFIPSL